MLNQDRLGPCSQHRQQARMPGNRLGAGGPEEDQLHRAFQPDAGRNVEDGAIGEMGGVEGEQGMALVVGCTAEMGFDKVGPGGERAGEGAARQRFRRRKVGAEDAVDEHQPVGGRHRRQDVYGYRRRSGRSRQEKCALNGAKIGETPSFLFGLGKAQFGEAGAAGAAQGVEAAHFTPPR